MNVGELLDILQDKPRDLEVCGSGYFGERLEITYNDYEIEVKESVYGSQRKIPCLVLEMEDAGEEPD